MTLAECACLELGPRLGGFDEAFVGVDRTNGRFGDVSIRTCLACGRRWLHYQVEYEAFSGSGRWYTGVLPEGADARLRPEEAVPLLERLPWHVYGGSFFGTPGRRGTEPLHVDLHRAAPAAEPAAPEAEAGRRELVQVLRDARALLARPENDFDWSSWMDADAALNEVDGLIAELESGRLPDRGDLSFLFVPTGPMQEVSLSSGWGSAFLALANRCDAALATVYPRTPE
jgi:hypothetical protein